MVVRFEGNEYGPHEDCSKSGPMHFPPVHFYQSLCVACNVEDFFENGEFSRWIFTILDIIAEPVDNCRDVDEYYFWRYWRLCLQEAAFPDEKPKKRRSR